MVFSETEFSPPPRGSCLFTGRLFSCTRFWRRSFLCPAECSSFPQSLSRSTLLSRCFFSSSFPSKVPFTLSLRWAAAAYLGSGSEELNEFMIFLQIRKCKQRLQRTMPSKGISNGSGRLTNIFRQQWCHTPCYYIFFLPTIFFSVDLIAAICYTSCWGRRKGGKEGKGGKDLVTMTGHTVRGWFPSRKIG